jgi:hypothetical protein
MKITDLAPLLLAPALAAACMAFSPQEPAPTAPPDVAPLGTPPEAQDVPDGPPATYELVERMAALDAANPVPFGRLMPDSPIVAAPDVAASVAVAAALPRTLPGIGPGVAGIPDDAPLNHTLSNTYGWGWGKEFPLVADNYYVTATNKSVVNTFYSGNGGSSYITSSVLMGQPVLPSDVKNNVFWIMLAFDQGDCSIWQSNIFDAHVEHGMYWTSCGRANIRLEEVLWSKCNAQAFQWVYSHPASKRYFQTAHTDQVEGLTNPPSAKDAEWLRILERNKGQGIEIIRCETVQCTAYILSERAGSTISKFEVLNQKGPWAHWMRVEGCYSKTSVPWIDPNGKQRDSCGWFMSHAGLTANGHPAVTLRHNSVFYLHPDRDFIQIWGCSDGIAGTPDVVIEENVFATDQAIDIRLRNANDTVIVRRNRNVGGARVIISGPEQPWYSWTTSPNWNKAAVIAEFPLDGASYQYGSVN